MTSRFKRAHQKPFFQKQMIRLVQVVVVDERLHINFFGYLIWAGAKYEQQELNYLTTTKN